MKHIKCSLMTRIAKAWTYFVAARLLLVSHFNRIAREQVLLVYAILKGFQFDVGWVIRDNIIDISKGSTTSGSAYPTIITTLCLNTGVGLSSNEIKAPIQKSITDKVIDSYKDEEEDSEHDDPSDDPDPEEAARNDMDVEEPNPGFNPEWMAGVDRELPQFSIQNNFLVLQNTYLIEQ